MAWLSAPEKADIFGRLNKLETTLPVALSEITAHVRGCRDDAEQRREAEIEAKRQRARFHMELRGYCVAILVALIGLIAAAKFQLL